LVLCEIGRLAKEKTSYEKELEKQQQKVDSMKAEDSDDYNIKKQVILI
jgi:Tubulin binding cofactor A